jgi:hypothetical protein
MFCLFDCLFRDKTTSFDEQAIFPQKADVGCGNCFCLPSLAPLASNLLFTMTNGSYALSGNRFI